MNINNINIDDNDFDCSLFLTNMFGGRQESYDIRHYEDGIGRKKISNEYEYFYIKNREKVSRSDLERIKKLKLPPAWTDVWISKDPKSEIQAIGIDAKGRKQYKYHESHIEEAEREKFIRLIDFIKAMPKLEKIMKEHKKFHSYDKYRVLTTVLTVVKELHMRVGKEQYARENKSYGVSSLKKQHVKIEGDTIKFNFKGKSNKRLSYSLYHPEIKTHIKMLLKLEGDKLFQYIDDTDTIRKITDTDLNRYIQDYMGSQFTIKDFRTYAANYYFVKTLLSETRKRTPKNEKIIKKNIINALNTTAHYLRHTRSISKKSYVMNFCIEMYRNDPSYFIQKKYDEADDVLLEILQLYKHKILKMK